ncbi:MAG: NAD(+)/NADH kinase [Acidimicrobiia bacterium]|nr:NAD(+)/NADH kinase [Acidimicrobiia bacterium]
MALVVHQARADAADVACSVADWLVANGHEVVLPPGDAPLGGAHPDTRWVQGDPAVPAPALAVSLGGDGTVLRTVELVAGDDVPVLGVNLGALGYLTEVEPPATEVALQRFFAGEYGIEERMLLAVHVARAGEPAEHLLALNEAAIEKTRTGHTVRLDLSVGGRFFTSYETDAMIVATPTGSTAHSFSARGPIVAPTHRLVLLTPVSPHMLFDRSLVLEPQTEVALTVAGHRDASLAVDGRLCATLAPGDTVTCRAATERARLVTFGPRDFVQILKAKFKLSDR